MTLPVPHDPAVPGPAAQAAALQQAVALSSARGWRVEGTAPGVATMVSGYQPNHVLHLLLTIFTCGLWAIVWVIIAVTSDQKRLTVVADLNGNVSYTQGPYLPPSPPPAPPTAPRPVDIGAASAKNGMSIEKQLLLIGAGFAVLLGIGCVVAAIARPSSTSTSTTSSHTATKAAAPTTQAAPATTQAAPQPPQPPPPPPPPPPIAEGTWTAGTDFPAGTYRTVGASSTCYWEITKSGTNGSDIVNNHIGGGNLTVTLNSGQDFTTNRCGTWTKVD